MEDMHLVADMVDAVQSTANMQRKNTAWRVEERTTDELAVEHAPCMVVHVYGSVHMSAVPMSVVPMPVVPTPMPDFALSYAPSAIFFLLYC